MEITMRGYGQIKVVGSEEKVSGEITLYAEGWVAVAPVSEEDKGEVRWFPNERVAELVWQKSLAVQQRR